MMEPLQAQEKETTLVVQGDSPLTVWTRRDSDFPVDNSTGQMGIHLVVRIKVVRIGR